MMKKSWNTLVQGLKRVISFNIEQITCFQVYAYKYRDSKGEIVTKIKSRGITMDKTASYEVTFESLLEMANNLVNGRVTHVNTTRPVIRKTLGALGTTIVTKQLKPVMDKVLFDKKGHTRPFGYR